MIELYLTGFILKLQESKISQIGRHICKECRHTKPKTNRQVDTYVRSVDTLSQRLTDRSTHM